MGFNHWTKYNMARKDYRLQRLFVDDDLRFDHSVPLEPDQVHYICRVLRMEQGQEILLFNGRDGEWRAQLHIESKKSAYFKAQEQARPQTKPLALTYAFAPLKHARQDYMIQKAVEMSVDKLQPVLTERTQMRQFNHKRAMANIKEAAEQCGVLKLAHLSEPLSLNGFLHALDQQQKEVLIFCDEAAPLISPLEQLQAVRDKQPQRISVLIGPEGGFSDQEQAMIAARSNAVAISLGSTVMRADTAAVAALFLVQALCFDW
jgi:16S rRNA (uracil1498-N3)-methyltransferase